MTECNPPPLRIAMWSGPRSLSTALMRAWENRDDTVVWDEPLYPAYLYETDKDDFYAQEITTSYETDWRKVIYRATRSSIPESPRIFYQKYISCNYIDHFGFEWLKCLKNCFLIRSPRDLVLSLSKKTSVMSVERTGIPRLYQIYQYVVENTDSPPPIICAHDLQRDPKQTLTLLCDTLGVPFDPQMLRWPSGDRQSDGIWSTHWYDSVVQSCAFKSYKTNDEALPSHLLDVVQSCENIYWKLYEQRLHG